VALIEVKGLGKSNGRAVILRDIEIEAERGEVLAIIGPTGSGKTTLLRLIDLLEDPSEGRIFFDGSEVTGLPEGERLKVRRRMAMVFQKPVMFRASVYDNVSYGLRIRGWREEDKVKEALRAVGLFGFEPRPATALSGGEMQRTALARALVTEPDLLLLDEPTASLDPRSAGAIEGMVSRLAKGGTAVIMATHDMLQCRRLADRVAMLVEGRIIDVGGPGQVLGGLEPSPGLSVPWEAAPG
jgi:tungstate transport system ATP-binding protein